MLQPLMANGTTTYALNVQLPLQTVDMINGPTSLCPATHSEVFCKRGLTHTVHTLHSQRHSLTHRSAARLLQVFCKRFLRGVCLEQTPGGKPPRAIDAMEAYVRLSGLCTMGSTRVHGTSSAKQAASHRHHLTSLPSHSPTLHQPCCTHRRYSFAR